MRLPSYWRWPALTLSLPETLVLLSIGAVLCGLFIPVGDHDFSHRYPPPASGSRTAFARVAGEYNQAPARGRNLRLSILPDGRYSFIWLGCTGVQGRESGSVRLAGEFLVLAPVKTTKPRIERLLFPVKWGPRTYLVPSERFQEFCDAIIKGEEPRNQPSGDFFLSTFEASADGTPALPARWATYLRNNLVIGTVVGLEKSGRAKIDVGSADGLDSNTIFTVQGSGRYQEQKLKVVSFTETSCEAEKGSGFEPDPPLVAGRRVVAARETYTAPGP